MPIRPGQPVGSYLAEVFSGARLVEVREVPGQPLVLVFETADERRGAVVLTPQLHLQSVGGPQVTLIAGVNFNVEEPHK